MSGLPGRMAIFQKSSSRPPPSPSALRTRSCSPTETPPVDTKRSAPAAPAARERKAWLSSPAIGRAAGGETGLARPEVETGAAHVVAGGRALAHDDDIALAIGVFLDDDAVRARR